MKVEDKIIAWFIKNVIAPRNAIYDKPGFLATRFVHKNVNLYLRQTVLPEMLFVGLENVIRDKYGELGERILYSAGKKYMYRYCTLLSFPTSMTLSEKTMEKFLFKLARYMEAISFGKIDYKFDYFKKTSNIFLEDFAVCPKNGLGYILSSGAVAGIMSFIFAEPKIECVQAKCQGIGDETCEIFCGPLQEIEKKGLSSFTEPNMKNVASSKDYKEIYSKLNAFAKPQHAEKSFKYLLDSGYMTYHQGVVECNDERFLIKESAIEYILEEEISNLKNGEKLLFDISFNVGSRIAKKEKSDNYKEFVTKMLSGFGWGDIYVVEKHGKIHVISDHFPWTEYSEMSKFVLYRGFVSGIISGLLNKKVIFDDYIIDMSEGFLSLTISESEK